MKNHFLMGVDIGTSNIKAMIFSLNGEIIAEASEEVRELYPGERKIEQNPTEIWEHFRKAVRRAATQPGVKPEDIAGLCLDSNRCGMLLLDGECRPLTNIWTWRDTRSENYINRFTAEHPEIDLYRIAGEEGRPQHTLFKIIWCQNELPDIWNESRYLFFSPKDYILFRLLKRRITSKSMAQSTGLFDINTLTYSKTVLEAIHLSESMLPELYDSNEIVGYLNRDTAAALNLSENTPLVCGLCDATASQFGSGSVKDGMFTISIGTCGAIRTVSPVPKYTDNAFAQIRVFSPYGYVPSCTITDAGSILKWYRNQFCRRESEQAEKQGQDVYSLIDREAAKIPAGADGLLLLPNFTGASYAFKNADIFGVFAGIRNYHTNAHFARAIMEGVGVSLRTVLDGFRSEGYAISQIRLGGGGAKSALWPQIIADIFNLPIHIPACEEASCLGSAMMAAMGLRLFDTPEQAVGRMVRIAKTCYPDETNARIYERTHRLFHKLNEALSQYYRIHNELTRQ